MSRAASGGLAYRAAATGILVGGSAAGCWLGGRSTRQVAAFVAGVALPSVLVLSRNARRVTDTRMPECRSDITADGSGAEPATSTTAPDGFRITVLVPARDEECHIGALLRDLGRQDRGSVVGPLCLRVVVIDDRSLDRTGAIAAEAMDEAGLDGRVIRRDGPAGTKGDVLRDVPVEAIGDPRLLVVLDADARVAPDFIRGVAEHHVAGNAAFTARRRISWADDFWLGRVQDDEQALNSWVLAGRIGLGGGGELRGNGMAVTPAALAAAGGWPGCVLTEDLEVSAALLSAGIAIAWAGHLVVEETAAGTPTALGRQRVRWAEGSARRFLTHLPAALSAGRATPAARLELALYACQLLLPPLILGTLVRGLACRRPGPTAVVVAGYVGTGAILAWSAIARLQEPAPPGRRALRALAVGAFSTHWLVALPVGLIRIAVGPEAVTFVRTQDRLAPRGQPPPIRKNGADARRRSSHDLVGARGR